MGKSFKVSKALGLICSAFALFIACNSFAAKPKKQLTRKQISKVIAEGEYVTDEKRIRKISPKPRVRRPANVRPKKRQPYNHTIPYAKETPHEKDMPFISVPTSKVRKKNKTIVMDDPSTEVKPVQPIAEPMRSPAEAREPDTFDIR